MRKFLVRLLDVNWFAIASVIFVVAMFVTVLSPVPDFFVLPLGFTALVCAVLNLNWLIESLFGVRKRDRD